MSYSIITPNLEGHYGYYVSLLNKEFDIKNVIVQNELTVNKVFLEVKGQKVLLLNFWALAKTNPFIYLLTLLLAGSVGQFIYNVDFLYKANLKSSVIKGLYKALKIFNKVISFTLVSHESNNGLGLAYIPDPIELPDLNNIPSKVPLNLNLPENFILLFGSHDIRKGTYNFIKHIPDAVNVVVVGKIHDQRIFEFEGKKGVLIHNNFVDENTKNVLFQKADCIAIPYQNWYGSSGVLGTAISFEKVIIGSQKYFVGKVLNEYNRSLIWNSETQQMSVDELSDQIMKLKQSDSNSELLISQYFSEKIFINKLKDWSI